jgi:two-component system sensor histidine kinase KdpD
MGNLSTLRELALRSVAEEVGSKAAQYRVREGLDPAAIPEKVMVCVSSSESAKRLLRAGARIAGRLGATWYAVYVQVPDEDSSRIPVDNAKRLEENFSLAEQLGATIVRLKAKRAADALIQFAKREGITHVIFGQSARSRWDILIHGSILNRFLSEVKDAAIQVIPSEPKAVKARHSYDDMPAGK